MNSTESNLLQQLLEGKTPRDLGFHFPAEWEPHEATWLSWPHKEESWPGKLHQIYKPYLDFVRELTRGEKVHINVNDEKMRHQVQELLAKHDVNESQVQLHLHPTNDAWCRDHGPAFLVNKKTKQKIILDWGYNAWGEKYPPFDLDDDVPSLIGESLKLPVIKPGIVMEGGSVDFNGEGLVLTTTQCLLNQNRNPHLNQNQIEQYLKDFYGVSEVLWLEEGIEGDDTDGHIDDISRFFSARGVLTVIEDDRSDANYTALKKNYETLQKMKLQDGSSLEVIELPMPDPVIYDGTRLPASYANFYVSNSSVIVPTYRCQADQKAIDIISKSFPDRQVIGIDSVDIVWGLGSFHCLSQQEPKC